MADAKKKAPARKAAVSKGAAARSRGAWPKRHKLIRPRKLTFVVRDAK